jgi:hypothetical protein
VFLSNNHGPSIAAQLDAQDQAPMTLKIVKTSRGRKTTIRMFGEAKSEHIDLIKAEMKERRPQIVFDLSEVSLVDVNIVRFLDSCEAEGIELLHCSRYLREWITRERSPS